MASPLTKKKRIRAGHRSVVTRRMEEARGLLEGDSPDPRGATRLALILQEKLEVLRQLDGEILDLTEDEADITNEIEHSDSYNQDICDLVLNLKECSKESTPNSTPATNPVAGGTPSYNARLPKLTLKPFDGDITKWLSFWDSYQAAVHSNPEISDVQKFTYLKSLVEGTAREAISGLSLSADNYEEAVGILEKRFGNKQRIIDRHLDILLNLEQVSSANNVVALRHLYDQVESNVRALGALGIPDDSYGTLLASVLLKKLPQEMRLLVSRKVTDEWAVKTIMKAIGEELEARERMGMSLMAGGMNDVKKKIERHSVATLITGQGIKENPICSYCKGTHLPSNCEVITSTEERRRILKSTGKCFICLRKGHISRDCRTRTKCRRCKGRHHTSLCQTSISGNQEQSTLDKSEENTANMIVIPKTNSVTTPLNPEAHPFQTPTTCYLSEGNSAILLQTAKVTLYNPHRTEFQLEVLLIFDSGSQRSYIRQSVTERLKLQKQGNKVLSIMTFGAKTSTQQSCEVVCVGLMKDGCPIKNISILSVPTICEPLKGPPVSEILESYPSLSSLELANTSLGCNKEEPTILIGLDYYWSFMTGEHIRWENGPVAVYTTLGWVLSGPVSRLQNPSSCTNLITHVLSVNSSKEITNQRLERRLKTFWDLETLGIVDSDNDMYEQFHDIVQFREGRYEVMLPWKDPMSTIPDNYMLSLKRLQALLRRLRKDSALLKQYDEIIKQQIKQGIVQLVEDPNKTEGDRIHYLPHHAIVKHERATTKVRIVYDASSKSKGPSLNESLHVGPKFNQKVFDILIRFRTHQVALIADIEKAFLMISVCQKDRDALRFLWLKDVNSEVPEIQTFRFTRVIFGVASSPFLLNATIRYHLKRQQESYPNVVEHLLHSIYVDDIITGAETPDMTYQLYVKSKRVLKKGGFNLRKFVTNEVNLQKKINEIEGLNDSNESETYAKTALGTSQVTLQGEQKVLGVRWKVDTDEFVFDLKEVIQAAKNLTKPTKRQIVSIVGKVYDPLGILAPIIIPLKTYLQELCMAKIQWDKPLTEQLHSRWETLIDGFKGNHTITIPRNLMSSKEATLYQLCGFGDASQKAYAAVVYLRTCYESTIESKIICCKTRVAPSEGLTIPRLELLSALLLARLLDNVSCALSRNFTLQPPLCFLDSKVAYYWICGEEKIWQPFVQNRVKEIRRRVPAIRWRHCAGSQNPADAPSRGQNLSEFINNKTWFTGPDWLLDVDEKCQMNTKSMPPECAIELKENRHILLMVSETTGVNDLINVDNYSEVEKLFRVTAYVMLFCERLKKTVIPPVLTVEIINKAEIQWILAAQSTLKREANYKKWKEQLSLFEDELGLLRCRGRLKNADIPYTVRYPLLIPKKHSLTLLLVRQAHEKVFHNGVKETLTQLRAKYWIIKGRSLVRSVIRRCVLCRKLEGCHYQAPPPPPLPTYRVEKTPPFTYCGVDFAGPLYIKTTTDTEKVWICLYTCCTTRAIHLDLVQDLSAQSFIWCFKRFTARRGLPRRMVSDNGKTFKSAAKIFKRIIRHEEVKQYLMGERIEWTFNLERAPWWGGLFERLIQSTKRCLRKMISTAKLSYEEMLTILTETEMIINSRPLSYISSEDLEEPLTPSHLIVGRRLLSLPDDLLQDNLEENYNTTPAILTKRMRFLHHTIERFWQRWKKEYLVELRTAHSTNKKSLRNSGNISEGDIVVVHDDNQRRGFWKLGVVEELFPGRDGLVRGAKIRVSTKGKTKSWKRPVQRLYPIEVHCFQKDVSNDSDNLEEQQNEADTTSASTQEGTNEGRPKRVAAFEARDRIVGMNIN